MAAGAEPRQRLYYPKFLPDPNPPVWLPGGDMAGIPEGANITFGTLSYEGRAGNRALFRVTLFRYTALKNA